jgi:hypothetical protein
VTNGELTEKRRLPGFVIGAIVAVGFGTGFIIGNSGGLTSPWPLILRVAAIVAAVALLIATFRAGRRVGPTTTAAAPSSSFMGRGYWLVVLVEAIALFGGLFVINGVLHRSEVAVAWVALVVGLHFYGLGWVWHTPLYHWLATGMTLLAVAGFILYFAGAGAAAISLVAGVGSGVALYLAVLWPLLQTRRPA